jgi:hypothetical protein
MSQTEIIRRKALNYRESRSLFEATKKYIENVNSIDPVLAYIINKDIDHLLLNGGDDELMDINNLEEIKSYLEISILNKEYYKECR